MDYDCPHVRRLLDEHEQLRGLSRDLMTLLAQPAPPAAETLADLRWNIARTVLRHLPNEDRYVYRRLFRHTRPDAIATAKFFQQDLQHTYEPYRVHSERWTIEAALADWPTYCAATRRLLIAVDDRMQREEEQLYPHLRDAPDFVPERCPDAHNFAGDAWAIRASLGRS